MHKEQLTFHRLSHSMKKRYAAIKRIALTSLYGRIHPSVMVIGAQKAGTTALFHYLSQHPSIVPSLKKELNYFCYDNLYAKGDNFYLDCFEVNTPSNQRKITLDVSPSYLFHADQSAARIHQLMLKCALWLFFVIR